MSRKQKDTLASAFAGPFTVLLLGSVLAIPLVGVAPLLVMSAAGFATAAIAKVVLPPD